MPGIKCRKQKEKYMHSSSNRIEMTESKYLGRITDFSVGYKLFEWM
jgi:hypothetical protein